ncbi:MAG: hypothetical protein NW216_04655 [Hyphomicrobium sp.]|nr:hypothetical protein [Hyphomicrobium sp.]
MTTLINTNHTTTATNTSATGQVIALGGFFGSFVKSFEGLTR